MRKFEKHSIFKSFYDFLVNFSRNRINYFTKPTKFKVRNTIFAAKNLSNKVKNILVSHDGISYVRKQQVEITIVVSFVELETNMCWYCYIVQYCTSFTFIMFFTYVSVNQITTVRDKIIRIRKVTSLLHSNKMFHWSKPLASTSTNEKFLH